MSTEYDIDAMLSSGDPFGPPFPELAPEFMTAVERALVRFEGSELCGVVVNQNEIWTHLEALPEEVRESGAFANFAIAARVGSAEIECRPEAVCPCCALARLGRPRGVQELAIYLHAMEGAPRLSVRPIDAADAFPVFILDPLERWVRGWQLGGEYLHELFVESHMTPHDVGCPVVDEAGRIVRVVETSDVNFWEPAE